MDLAKTPPCAQDQVVQDVRPRTDSNQTGSPVSVPETTQPQGPDPQKDPMAYYHWIQDGGRLRGYHCDAEWLPGERP